MKITHTPYYLNEASIMSIEDLYDAKYMGPWTIKDRKGEWSKKPVEVFYQYEPDKKKGYTHYFGIFLSNDVPCIINAESSFSVPITGILVGDEVIISRCRHDFVSLNGFTIDGGRDYTRIGGENPQLVEVTVQNDQFVFKLVKEKRKRNVTKRNLNSSI